MKHFFTPFELCVTDTGLNNTPVLCSVQDMNLHALTHVLDVLRHLVDCPIIVNSAFRSPAVNCAVGGSPNSLHLQGRAADIKCEYMDRLREVCSVFYKRGILVEYIEYPTFVHIGI